MGRLWSDLGPIKMSENALFPNISPSLRTGPPPSLLNICLEDLPTCIIAISAAFICLSCFKVLPRPEVSWTCDDTLWFEYFNQCDLRPTTTTCPAQPFSSSPENKCQRMVSWTLSHECPPLHHFTTWISSPVLIVWIYLKFTFSEVSRAAGPSSGCPWYWANTNLGKNHF